MRSGAELIAQERSRQIVDEGHGPQEDDRRSYGVLSLAGACYAMVDNLPLRFCRHLDLIDIRALWPFDPKWFKPKDPERNLVRAGALIAAEIDRLHRKQMKGACR